MMRSDWMEGLLYCERLWEGSHSTITPQACLMGLMEKGKNHKDEPLTHDFIDGFQDCMQHYFGGLYDAPK